MSGFLDGRESTNQDTLKINQKFAEKYDARKKKEEMARLKYEQVEEEDESDSETEDEDGEELTKEVDRDIMKTLKLIKAKDPAIYDSSITFFKQEDEDEKEKEKKDKPLYYKDLIRKQALDGTADMDSEDEEDIAVQTYAEEQKDIKKEFLKSLEEDEGDDDEFLTVREKNSTGEEEIDGNQPIEQELDSEAFLQQYMSSRGWIDKNAQPSYTEIVDDEEDADALEEADEFEKQYNFRFEEEGGNMIKTHSRHVEGSMRRVDDTRKRKRQERKERKALERQKKEEKLRRLKNLKQQEIQEKMDKIAEIAGKNISMDIETAFDPEEHDRMMAETFNDDYYDDIDDKKPTWDDDVEGLEQVEDIEQNEDEVMAEEEMVEEEIKEDEEPYQDISDEVKEKTQKYLDELYKLDYEDMIGDMPCRFKYRSVPQNSYGISTDLILKADDKDLKEFVSLKRMAPYADEEYEVSKKRLNFFKYQMKVKEREAALEKEKHKKNEEYDRKDGTSDEDSTETMPAVVSAVVESVKDKEVISTANTENSKKKRKRKKKKVAEPVVPVSKPVGISASRLESYRLKPLNK